MLRRLLPLALGLALVGCDDASDLEDDPELTVPGTEIPENPPPPEPGALPPGYAPNDDYDPRLAVPGQEIPEAPTPPMPPGMAGMPPGGMQPQGGPVPLAPGFSPQPLVVPGVIVPGTQDAAALGPGCLGHIPAQPNHVMQVQGNFPRLRVMVNSQADTVLVIRAANGTVRCNDDLRPGESLNPGIDGPFPPGAYQVFVGSYQTGAQGPYAIGFTENPAILPEQLPLTAPGGPMPPGGPAPPGGGQPMIPSN